MLAEVFVKSHGEYSDYEQVVKAGTVCTVPYIDDPDQTSPAPCMGEIKWQDGYGRCQDCLAEYMLIKEE
jgi:hypothetical protein